MKDMKGQINTKKGETGTKKQMTPGYVGRTQSSSQMTPGYVGSGQMTVPRRNRSMSLTTELLSYPPSRYRRMSSDGTALRNASSKLHGLGVVS